jgi:hypothetical protein
MVCYSEIKTCSSTAARSRTARSASLRRRVPTGCSRRSGTRRSGITCSAVRISCSISWSNLSAYEMLRAHSSSASSTSHGCCRTLCSPASTRATQPEICWAAAVRTRSMVLPCLPPCVGTSPPNGTCFEHASDKPSQRARPRLGQPPAPTTSMASSKSHTQDVRALVGREKRSAAL